MCVWCTLLDKYFMFISLIRKHTSRSYMKKMRTILEMKIFAYGFGLLETLDIPLVIMPESEFTV